MSDEQPFGFEVVYEARTGMVGTEERTFHGKGSEATMRRRALWKRDYIRVVELRPFTEEQYIRCFGIPGSRM